MAGSMVLVLVLVLGGAGSAYAKAGKPTTPDNLRADVTASSVTVTWDPSTSNAGVTIYFVQLNGQLLWTTEPTITLHLARSTTYELLVQAQDAAWRRSDWSDPLRFTTPDEFPVTTPAGVQVSASPGSLTVQWQPASSDAGVLDYTTTVRGGPDGPLAQRTTGTTATIDLPPGGDLDVTVRARDRAYRWSDTSDPVPVTVPPAQEWSPPGAPSALRAVFDPQDRVERVEWDAAGGGGDTTITYHLKLDGDEIESTRQLFVELFSFAACPDGARSTLAFTVSATSNGFESADSEPITLCFD